MAKYQPHGFSVTSEKFEILAAQAKPGTLQLPLNSEQSIDDCTETHIEGQRPTGASRCLLVSLSSSPEKNFSFIFAPAPNLKKGVAKKQQVQIGEKAMHQEIDHAPTCEEQKYVSHNENQNQNEIETTNQTHEKSLREVKLKKFSGSTRKIKNRNPIGPTLISEARLITSAPTAAKVDSPSNKNDSKSSPELDEKHETAYPEPKDVMHRYKTALQEVIDHASTLDDFHQAKQSNPTATLGPNLVTTGDVGNDITIIEAFDRPISTATIPFLSSIHQESRIAAETHSHQADRDTLSKRMQRVEKKKEGALRKKPVHPKTSPPAVDRAIEILQWAWEEEKSNTQTSHAEAIGVLEQILAQTQQEVAELSSGAQVLKKHNQSLEKSSQALEQKLATISESYKTVKLGNQGLGRDVEKARKDCMDSYEKLNTVVREYKELKLEHDIARKTVNCLENDLHEFKAEQRSALLECQIQVQQSSIENGKLESKLEAQAVLISSEKERVLFLQWELKQQHTLKQHMESLIKNSEDQLITKLNEMAARQNTNMFGKGTMERLRVLLEEMQSNKTMAPNPLEQSVVSLEALQKRYILPYQLFLCLLNGQI
jgi:hypothetical protein